MEEKAKRIQKILSEQGICSRRKAEELILSGKILINNKIAKLGECVTINDEIKINNRIIKLNNNVANNFKYIVLNKPMNIICTASDPQNRKTIYEYLKAKERLFSIGRLDFNTTGIILITNDGEFANLLSHPSSKIPRIYIATLEREMLDGELNLLNSNHVLLNGKISKQKVTKLSAFKYEVLLYEGRNHHVKNLFLLVNNYVKKLHRKSFGCIDDSNLKIGQYRDLTSSEINNLLAYIKK
ncbi:rRNA pseudouridine synthase [Metamycoplasma hominis]|uniref:pseudouridine synthase n=1 Tax=Metamycoplasma hominis TaxID=2098 RepID=UPI001593CFB5|nr:pseudouridine synthase [Metamycoplasma hominis]QKX37663.1 rRNA pseudouridine synthase [Metamycoplasma hominis]